MLAGIRHQPEPGWPDAVRWQQPPMSPSEVASHAARARWVEHEGNPVLTRSAQVVIERAAELPAGLREQVHQVTGPPGGETRGDG
jgi:hypothetical protein